MKYLIDANIFLHAALEQENEDICKEFLDKVSEGDIDASVTLFHLDASAVVMQRKGISQNALADFYFEAYRSEGLEVINLGIPSRLNALTDDKHSRLDDSLLLQAYRELDNEKIVTYDKDFKDKKRTTPRQVLNK